MTALGTALSLAAAQGALVAAGLWLILSHFRRSVSPLGAALGSLAAESETNPQEVVVARGERLGRMLHGLVRLPLSENQLRLLRLRGVTVAGFYTEKAVLALVGLGLPTVVAGAFVILMGTPWAAPVIAGLVGGVIGFFVPDLLLAKGARSLQHDAGEALFTFFDLITIERLANQSATQALHTAAGLSEHALFRQLRSVLERARLQQRTPYAELRALADDLDLPQLGDIADVMQLDEQGAALTGTLRARVKELRDQHLTQSVIAAQEVSERMTVFVVLPAMVFGLIFLVPPVLRLIE